jgi:translation initiation factor IF-3
MRISRRRFRPTTTVEITKSHRVNHFIKAPELRLIDENNANVGVVTTSQALAMALERGLDLVEVSPLANPPVAKILDFAKMKYQEEKERRKERAKQKPIEIKGIRLSLRIGEHDTDIRAQQALRFLGDGDKVRVELILRGRERQHTELAKTIMMKFVDTLNAITPVMVEQAIGIQGGKLSLLLGKKS